MYIELLNLDNDTRENLIFWYFFIAQEVKNEIFHANIMSLKADEIPLITIKKAWSDI